LDLHQRLFGPDDQGIQRLAIGLLGMERIGLFGHRIHHR
jgi:hypothetical protein